MALQKLRFLSFNNYYNRKVKPRGSYIQDYADALIPRYDFTPSVSFNPGNWVDTYGIEAINWPESLSWRPDYLLVYHHDDTTNKDVIDSRWFITAWDRTKIGQYKMRLHRDVMVDHLDAIMDTPVYLERGILNNNDPYIFNDEGIAVNQVKTSETPLVDESGIAWIIAYVARDSSLENPVDLEAQSIPDLTIDVPFTEWEYYDYWRAISDRPDIINRACFGEIFQRTFSVSNVISGTTRQASFNYETGTWTGWQAAALNLATYSRLATLRAQLAASIDSDSRFLGAEGYQQIVTNWVGKVVYSSASGILNKLVTQTVTDHPNVIMNQTAKNLITEIVDEAWADVEQLVISDLWVDVYNATNGFLQRIPRGNYTMNYPSSNNRLHLKDAPFDMLCIPYAERYIRNTEDEHWVPFTIHKNEALSLAQDLALKLGSNLLDLQLLPYCPMTGFEYTDNYIDIKTKSGNSQRYTLIYKKVDATHQEPAAILLWSTASSGHKIISKTINITNKKMSSLTDFYRLSSPNRNGAFDFNAAKNNGIHNFNVYYTYMPGNPFIQVNPVYNGLYGQSFEDARGLCVQGDFSLARASDAWVEYQNQNKNYQNIFNRSIENMDVQHKYNMIEGAANMIAGTGQGAATGAVVGSMFAPGIGTAVGALAGGVGALGAGIADQVINQKRYEEDRSFAVDNFHMQCDNIKALPQSIAKTTAFSEINPIFPVLEYFTCTDEEKLALARKIQYNGMTIGRIGTLDELKNNRFTYSINGQEIRDEGFVRGKLIRLANRVDGEISAIAENYEVLLAIASELEKGVYFR